MYALVHHRCTNCHITHSQTFSLTNDEMAAIVAQPCHYCGKESNPPHHYNGLDRLTSDVRVYRVDTVVSCCGTCTWVVWTHAGVTDFGAELVGHCTQVHVSVAFTPLVLTHRQCNQMETAV